jgi:hypothetical protein
MGLQQTVNTMYMVTEIDAPCSCCSTHHHLIAGMNTISGKELASTTNRGRSAFAHHRIWKSQNRYTPQ